MTTYLDDNGNPVAAPQAAQPAQAAAPQYLDDNGNPIPASQGPSALDKSNAAADQMAKDHPQLPDNGGFTWEGVKKAPGRFWGGVKQVGEFANSVLTDISDSNKPLFVSDDGAAPGSEGESTFYKYGLAPQIEQFNQAQEMARQANEEYRKGNDVAVTASSQR